MRDIAAARGFAMSDNSDEHVLTNRNATIRNVLDGLERIFDQLKAGDILFVTFAGHAFVCYDKPRSPDGRQPRALCLYDGLLSESDLARLFAGINVPVRVVVVVDACFSGQLVTSSQVFGCRCSDPPDVILLAACDDSVVARGAKRDDRYPPFTSALLDVWASAKDYVDLHRLLVQRAAATGSPRPVLNTSLLTDPSFVSERPFSISSMRNG